MKYYICLDSENRRITWIFKSSKEERHLVNSVLRNKVYTVLNSWEAHSSPLEGDTFEKNIDNSYTFSSNFEHLEFPLEYDAKDNFVNEEEFRMIKCNYFYQEKIQEVV